MIILLTEKEYKELTDSCSEKDHTIKKLRKDISEKDDHIRYLQGRENSLEAQRVRYMLIKLPFLGLGRKVKDLL